MSTKTKTLIVLVILVQLVVIAGLLALPVAVQAIPGRYRVALAERSPLLSEIAEEVINVVAPVAPLPTPAQVASVPVDVAQLIATPTVMAPTPTLLAPENEETPLPTAEPTLAPTMTPTDTPTPEPTATPTATPVPDKVLIEGVPRVQQFFNNCGPANLTQVLNFYQFDVNQGQVASVLKPNNEDRNVSPWQIAEYVNNHTNLRAAYYSGGTLDLLKQLIAAGIPVVIEKGYEPNTPNAEGWFGHYLTVFGYDDTTQKLNGMDTYLTPSNLARGFLEDYAVIERYWQQFNYTFYLVYRPDQEAAVNAILGPAMQDAETMWRNAAARAETERTADPGNAFAWFNLGTSLTELGLLTGDESYYQVAAQAFDEARTLGLPPRMLWYQFRPYMAYLKVGRYQDVIDLANATLSNQGGRNVEETYWYKGHALAFLGDAEGATRAYQDALVVNVNFTPAQLSLDSLGG